MHAKLVRESSDSNEFVHRSCSLISFLSIANQTHLTIVCQRLNAHRSLLILIVLQVSASYIFCSFLCLTAGFNEVVMK